MREKGIGQTSPEERTAAFFEQDFTKLCDDLLEENGMVIALPNSDRKIRIVELEEWAKQAVGKRYKARGIENMRAGDLWNPSARAINQSLIIAKDKDGVGACVRLLKAEYWDPASNEFIPALTEQEYTFGEREGDIAKYLGLGKNEKSRLRFLDDSRVLYIVRNQTINPDAANHALENFLQEQ